MPNQLNNAAQPGASLAPQPLPVGPGQTGTGTAPVVAPASPPTTPPKPPSPTPPVAPAQAPAVPAGSAAGSTGASDLRSSPNIQGNILAGFRKDHQVFAFLRLPADPAQARSWLNDLLPRIAATREVAAFNARFSAARRQNGGDDPKNLQSKWVNIGLTASGLQGFGSPRVAADLVSFGASFAAFVAGAASRAFRLGDVAPASDPSRWLIGGPAQPRTDVILTVAADDPDDLVVEMEKLRALATKYGLVTVFEQRGGTLPGERAGHEHFGFKDGTSQPGVRGFDAPGPAAGDRDNIDGRDHSGEVAGSAGTKLVAAGEFVLGHPREGGASPWSNPAWMADGSFQVWRRLTQDVPGFWSQVTAQLEDAFQKVPLPPTDPATEDQMAARLMGRWRSGTPVDAAPDADDRSARDPQDDNDFDFTGRSDDGSRVPAGSLTPVGASGLRCPVDAHIRKMNPRNGMEAQRRVIRRGIPFGLPFDPAAGRGQGVDADRGLLFMAFMASIEEQFEFLQSAWANGSPPGGGGPDPIIGIPAAGAPTHTIQRASQPAIPLTLKRFVQTTGAVYAFAPSLNTLKALATGTL